MTNEQNTEFETWWEEHGQYCRSGGGEYEKSFSHATWEHCTEQAARSTIAAPEEPKPLPNRREHELKVWPEFYGALHSGEKNFELRGDDRGYRAGDVLWLREWNPRSETYSGREMRRRVTYIISGWWGLDKDVVCMALAAAPASTAAPAQEGGE